MSTWDNAACNKTTMYRSFYLPAKSLHFLKLQKL